MSNPKPFLEPDDVYARMKELERRVKALETSPRLPNSSITTAVGTFDLSDLVPSAAVPLMPAPSAASVSVTANVTNSFMVGSTFAEIYDAVMLWIPYDSIYIAVPWATDAGTTGELDLADLNSGASPGTHSTAYTLPANSAGYVGMAWKHGRALGLAQRQLDGTGLFRPAIRARRTGGAGNVSIFVPHEFLLCQSYLTGATTNGLFAEI